MTMPSLAPPPQAAPTVTTRVCASPQELAAHSDAWADLASHAAEPNVFHEPWFLLPAVEAFGKDEHFLFVLAYSDTELIGFFPLARRRGYRGMPLSYVTLWQHTYAFHGTPLVRQGHERDALRALLAWAAQDGRCGAFLELPGLDAEGPFALALGDVLRERVRLSFVVDQGQRAFFRPATHADATAYIEDALRGKRIREYRRQERRLGEPGGVTYRVLDSAADLEAWVGQFLALEASGWKGQEGTALGLREPDRTFFAAVCKSAFERGRLMMLGLFAQDKPVAMKVNFLAPPGAFAFKIAFDEAFARFSPGVLLEMENVRRVYAMPELAWMDSCAVPDHFMINRLWLERRAVETRLVSAGGVRGVLALRLLPALRWLKRKARSLRRQNAPGTSPGENADEPHADA